MFCYLVLLSIFGGKRKFAYNKQVRSPDLERFVLQIGFHKKVRRWGFNNCAIRGAESWSSTSDQYENTVEVSCTMREEPIESHPNFESWAGTPQKPNCGIFDEDGKFTGWNSKTEGGKIMAGVKSYLVPSYSGTVSYISKGVPSLGGIGRIGGGGGLPSVGGMYQWMCTGISYQSMSDGNYKVSETYLLSGPKGWNRYIYS